MKPYYVILTGGKNNAGDFLIKHRALALFARLRGDRDVVDLNGWQPLAGKSLETVNGATALVLMGGPALQERMYPDVYPLTTQLDHIKVPIIAMGIGWKSRRGDWQDTYSYRLGAQTLRLLDRIRESGYLSGVRDFHTLNVLAARKHDNYRMTGCPAYYVLDEAERVPPGARRPRKVAFSLGVTFVQSRSMERQAREQILALRARYPDSEFEVAFHHSLDPAVYAGVYGNAGRHNDRHLHFADWLDRQGIGHVDISGGVEKLIAYYDSVDLHVGYRVHAHIYMNSRSKSSVLIAEDGRGRATGRVMGGMLVDGFSDVRTGPLATVSRRFGIGDTYTSNPHSTREILALLDYETASGGHFARLTRALIDGNFAVMKRFMEQLP